VTGDELDHRIRLTGLSIKEFAAAAFIPVGTLYGYRRGFYPIPVTVTAHLHTVLEQLIHARIDELRTVYPQKESKDASPPG